MARPRKPDHVHALQGTKPHTSTAKTHSDVPASAPRMPGHLTPEARKEWKRVLPMLLERGSMTDGDAAALSMYVEIFARWVAAKKDVEENGLTITTTVLDKNGEAVSSRKVNPALRVAQDCEKSLRASLRELGLTPASRTKVLPAIRQEPKEESAWDILQKAKQQ
jgi:P27 family predicted phage terminase small subunit